MNVNDIDHTTVLYDPPTGSDTDTDAASDAASAAASAVKTLFTPKEFAKKTAKLSKLLTEIFDGLGASHAKTLDLTADLFAAVKQVERAFEMEELIAQAEEAKAQLAAMGMPPDAP